jgi:hypothetical protein
LFRDIVSDNFEEYACPFIFSNLAFESEWRNIPFQMIMDDINALLAKKDKPEDNHPEECECRRKRLRRNKD